MASLVQRILGRLSQPLRCEHDRQLHSFDTVLIRVLYRSIRLHPEKKDKSKSEEVRVSKTSLIAGNPGVFYSSYSTATCSLIIPGDLRRKTSCSRTPTLQTLRNVPKSSAPYQRFLLPSSVGCARPGAGLF